MLAPTPLPSITLARVYFVGAAAAPKSTLNRRVGANFDGGRAGEGWCRAGEAEPNWGRELFEGWAALMASESRMMVT